MQPDDPAQPAAPESDEAARQRRLRALSEIAQHAQQLERGFRPAAPAEAPRRGFTRARKRRPATTARHGRGRLTLGLLAGVLVLAVIGGALWRFLPRGATSTHRGPTTAVVLHLTADGIACPTDATWATDAPTLAVLGTDSCGGSARNSFLNIYDGRTGSLVRQLKPDMIVRPSLTALAAGSGVSGTPAPFFDRVLWAGDQLALPFYAFSTQPSGQSLAFKGLLVMTQEGGGPVVSVWPDANARPGDYHVWDVAATTVQTLHAANADDQSVYATLPVALTYAWDSAGHLAPATPLPTDAQPIPRGPVGNPAGDQTYTLWQPAELALARAPDGTATYPGVFTFSTDYAAWSPGGGYLEEPLTLRGYTLPALHLPPPAAMRAELHLDRAPLVPLRDAAMQAVYNALASNANPDVTAAQVAWRPDGTVLAAQLQLPAGGAGASTASHAVTLYRTDTGAVLATLQPPAKTAPYILAPSLLRWSPDGARLLLLDHNLDGAVIWQPAALPTA